jgi:hypothetical protein
VPALRAFIQVNKDGDWGNIKARFAQPEAAGTFPCAMAPLSLSPLDITALVVGVERGDAGERYSRPSKPGPPPRLLLLQPAR